MNVPTITPRQLDEVLRQGEPIDLIDVRSPVEFHTSHALPARNVPFETLDPQQMAADRSGNGQPPLYVICQIGLRSREACERLIAAGVQNVYSVEGGTRAWQEAQLPMILGTRTVSLERQVRIVAGFLALLGGVLAVAVHPYFALLPAFIGAGLLYAGISNTCGMAAVLVKMPWNRPPQRGQ